MFEEHIEELNIDITKRDEKKKARREERVERNFVIRRGMKS